MRNPRREAAHRVGGHLDVRVLEPSPPAVAAPPFFADDPVEGGEVLPFARAGARTWASLCDASDDDELLHWCHARWLVRAPLAPVPIDLASTRQALHAIAEHVLAPARWRATGKIGLRYTFRGFGTPFLPGDHQSRVEDGDVVWDDERAPVRTLAEAAALLGAEPGAAGDVYAPTTACDPGAPLTIDDAAARFVGDWFGFGASVLEELRDRAAPADDASRVQLWPEHFDLSVEVGAGAARAACGASPGDDGHPQPYLYVSPWAKDGLTGELWNEPFGASLAYADLVDGADPVAFFARACEALQARELT